MINKIKKLYKKYEEIINYIIVGVLTTIVSIASYYFFRFLIFTKDSNFDIQVCTVISWILAVLFAFVTNKRYVFKSKEKGKSEIIEMFKFYGSRLTTLLIEMLSMYILTDLINVNDKLSKILVQFIVLVLNYLFSKLFVFKKSNSNN